jgi:hypothetical protein
VKFYRESSDLCDTFSTSTGDYGGRLNLAENFDTRVPVSVTIIRRASLPKVTSPHYEEPCLLKCLAGPLTGAVHNGSNRP